MRGRLALILGLLVLATTAAPAATFESLVEAASRELTPHDRLVAATAALTYPGGKTMMFADAFVKSEPGEEVRRAFLLALATAPAHADNPDATRLLAAALAEDASPVVRRAAAEALATRGDTVGLGAALRATRGDADKDVRKAAAHAVAVLTAPRKAKPRTKALAVPNETAVKGRDRCPDPGGWCECAGAIRRPAKCLSLTDCRVMQSEMRHHDLTCQWNSQTLSEAE